MILDRLWGGETRAEAINLTHPGDHALVELFAIGQDTTSGVVVTENNALNYSAVYGAVKCIAETIGGLERAVYMIAENGDSELLSDHQTTRLINLEPNENMTPSVFWETLQGYLLLWGNAFAEIERNRLGEPVALWPRHPSRVQIQRMASGRLSYVVNPPAEESGQAKTVLAADMLHVPCMGTGEVGVSVVSYARESLGLGMASERFGGAFFGNGAKVGGLLQLSRPATKERKIQIAEDWKREFGGPRNASRLAVIDHDSTYTQIGIPPEDAQFLETRQFQVQEVCRWFRISPTKLMDFTHATFSNIEEINKQFAAETILPWAIKWAQECRRKLLPENERTNHVVRHDISKLIEGDLDTLTQIFSRGRQWGWYSINDIRRKLGENTIGEAGDDYLQPANMMVAGEEMDPQAQQTPEPGQAGANGQQQARSSEEFRSLNFCFGKGLSALVNSATRMNSISAEGFDEDITELVELEIIEQLDGYPPRYRWHPKMRDIDIDMLRIGIPIIPPARRKNVADCQYHTWAELLNAKLRGEGDSQQPAQGGSEAIRDEFQALRDEITSLRRVQHEMREELVAAIHAKFARKAAAELRKAAVKSNPLAHMDRYLTNLEPKLRAELETVTADATAAAATHVFESRHTLLAALECQPEQLMARLDELGAAWIKQYSGT